jgi:hypothetical protein
MAWPGRSGLHGRLLSAPEAAVLEALAESGAGVPRPGRRGMEDRRRLPVGQRESEAQAGGAVREYLPAQHRRAGTGATRRPAAGGHRAAPGRGVDSGPRRRGVHPGGPGTQGLPGGLLGRSRRLVGEVRRVGSAAEREGDPGIRHLAHERDRAGAVRAQRAGADRARPRSADRQVFRQSRRDAGGAGEAGPDQGAVRRLGLRRDRRAARSCAGSTTTCSTPRGPGASMART